MNAKIIMLTGILTLFIVALSHAQTPQAPGDVHLNLELVTPKEIPDAVADTLLNPMSILTSSDEIIVSVFMTTADTVNLASIHVSLGETNGGSELAQQQAIAFDNTNPATPFSYERDGNVVKIGLGTYTYRPVFYCEVYFEDTNGNTSAVTTYVAD